jgi:hypothetical protein
LIVVTLGEIGAISEFSTDFMTTEKEYYSHEDDEEVALRKLTSAEREDFIAAVNHELENVLPSQYPNKQH